MYKEFAILYDEFINVPYDRWANFISKEIRGSKLVLDLCCGTGTLTGILKKIGYDMIGIDGSLEMLTIAKDKNPDILFLHQDIRDFELYGTVDAVICTCDALNYILEEEELLGVFKLVKNYLNPNGTFIFDVKTEETFKNLMERTFYESELGLLTCELNYDDKTKINEYLLNIFIKIKGSTYEKSFEIHKQRAFNNIDEIVEKAGFTIMKKRENYSENDIDRTVYVCGVQ